MLGGIIIVAILFLFLIIDDIASLRDSIQKKRTETAD